MNVVIGQYTKTQKGNTQKVVHAHAHVFCVHKDSVALNVFVWFRSDSMIAWCC